MPPSATSLERLTIELRACFNRLKAVSDALCADLGLNASMRAVLEALDHGGEQQVPDIARARGVSRQHIQVNMDALMALCLVEVRDNPAHRRSPLYALSNRGKTLFGQIRQREAAVFARLAARFDEPELAATCTTLEALKSGLDAELEGGHSNA